MAGQIEISFFIDKFREQFDEEDRIEEMLPETEFRNLAGWSSMQALVIMASFDWNYGITLTEEELRNSKTIQELFDTVMAKKP